MRDFFLLSNFTVRNNRYLLVSVLHIHFKIRNHFFGNKKKYFKVVMITNDTQTSYHNFSGVKSNFQNELKLRKPKFYFYSKR